MNLPPYDRKVIRDVAQRFGLGLEDRLLFERILARWEELIPDGFRMLFTVDEFIADNPEKLRILLAVNWVFLRYFQSRIDEHPEQEN